MRRLLLAAVILTAGCSHQTQALTAPEHRAVAAEHQRAADAEKAQYDPGETRRELAPRSPFSDEGPNHFYNPTAAHLAEADRQMLAAFDHLKAAQQLERYEDVACGGITVAERKACPLLAPYVSRVEEIAQGLTLHLRPDAPAKTLATQLKCHLAFAEARGFDRAPCPLYVKGVKIALTENQAIDFRSLDPGIATEVRHQARLMFGEPTTGP